jgi:hypothetical protein
VKIGRCDEVIKMIEASFKNQSKKFYNLILDFILQQKQAKKMKTDDVRKKDIFKYLDCEEILPSLLLIYLVF